MLKRLSRKAWAFWPLLLTVLLADCTTKRAAVDHLSPPGTPHQVVGETVRLTLSYNQGSAMGLASGMPVRVGLGVIALVLGAGVLVWYRRLPPSQRLLPAALGLILAGALGNGFDRIVSRQGVVDFIDIGFESARFYVFNVADIGITVGAVLLGIHLLREEARKTSHKLA